jgi:molecular chaperone HscB
MQEEDQDQEPRVSDHFELFGIPRRYALDPKELQQSYRNLMAKYHPDRRNQQSMGHHGNDDDDGDMDASQITNAYQILREPHTRATYLLELLGHPIEETANTASLIRPEFLLQVMEWRETIDSLDPSSGDHDDMEVLEDLLSQTKDEIQGVMSQLDEAFQKQDLNRAMQLSAQLQYWHRIEETIQDKM